ncbi:MAG: glycosyltransferase family 2 protein [Candidatus Zixiibacteriota bacterium]
MTKGFLVLIPAYNAASTILELIEKTSKFIDRDVMVVVDDGSGDQTSQIAQKAGVVVLKHDRNQGKGEALKTGFRYAVENNYDAVITMDADLQHDPRSLPDFMRKRGVLPAILIGTRRMDLKTMPLSRWLSNKLTSTVLSILSGQSIRDSQSGYRLIPIEVIRSVKLESKKYDLESEILVKASRKGFRINQVAIDTIYAGGRSFIRPLTDTGRFLRLMWRSLWW